MKNPYLILPLTLLAFAFAINANANTVQLTLVNVGPGYNDGSDYVYPYNFSINGSSVLTSLLCDDYNDSINFGETWKANVYTFSDIVAGNGQMQPFGGLVATGQRIAAYKDAAWLYQQLILSPTETNAVNINHAIWGLFTATPFNTNTSVTSWFNAANQATSTLSNDQAVAQFSNVVFYTPVAGSQLPVSDGRPQEFIGTSSVPEPSSVMLLAFGLFGLGVLRQRRRHQFVAET
jgi:hypothetical protein